MIQQKVEELVNKNFGSTSKKINVIKLTNVINKEELDNVDGYLKFCKEIFGANIFFSNALYDQTSIVKYLRQCEQEVKDLPQYIYNAGKLFEGLVSSKIGTEEAFERLSDMVDEHIMYLLLKSSLFPATKYLKAAKRYYNKFPEAVEALPNTFNSCKEELRDDTSKLA